MNAARFPWRGGLGGLAIAWGLFLALGAIVNAERRGWTRADTVFWWVIVALPLAMGIGLIGWAYLRGLRHRQETVEHAILDAAAARGGEITATQLARSTDLTLDQAEGSLRYLARRDHLTPHLTDDGIFVYRLGFTERSRAPRPPRGPEAGGLGLDQLHLARRIGRLAIAGLLAALVLLSIGLTLLGPTLWPIRL